MKQLITSIAALVCLTITFSCSDKKKPAIKNANAEYCAMIDSMILYNDLRMTNGYMTQHYEDVQRKAGIKGHAEMGTMGIYYYGDSLFRADMAAFSKALGCGSRP